MYNFPIGVIVDSFRTDIKTAIVKASELGADGIQMYATSGNYSPEKLKGAARRELLDYVKAHGLKFSALCGDLGMGFFRPENAQQALICMEMMEFEGKEEMKEQISKIAREHQESIGMQESMMKMARILDAQNGTDIANGLQAAFEIG